MKFDHRHYIPCLRWKMGEYQAVYTLSDTKKRMFTPLIEVPEIGWDFEENKEKKTIDEHLSDFVLKKIYKKWGNTFCFVDLKLIGLSVRMKNGIHPLKYVFDDLRKEECSAIPVTGLDRDKAYQQVVTRILTKDNSGVCLRISIEEAAKNSFRKEINSSLSALDIQANNCDLIIDLGAPNFLPLDGFSMVIQQIVSKLPYLNDWRTFTVLSTSFPATMAGIKKGGEVVTRHEWQLYKILVADLRKAKLRLPTFGDHTISHPQVLDMDMRLLKPNATIKFTIDDGWYIVKGNNVKDYGYEQFHGLSEQVLAFHHYRDSTFSWGKEYIRKCANRSAKRGNLTKWVQVGTNHHIEKVTQDISSFYASLNTP